MSTDDRRRQLNDHPQGETEEARAPILGLITALEQVCQPGTPAQAFMTELLRGFVALSSAAYGAFWRDDRDTGTITKAIEVTPQVSEQAAQEWLAPVRELADGVIRQSIIRYRAVGEPPGQLLTGESYVALGFPIQGDPGIAGCVTIVVKQGAHILSGTGIALLQFLANFGLLYGVRRSAAQFEGLYNSLSSAWTVIGEMLAFPTPVDMAHVLVNRLRSSLHADRVSLGYVKRGRATVVAISGEDIIAKRSNIVRLIQAAQSEAIVSGAPCSYSEAVEGTDHASQLTRNPQQEQLARVSGAKAVYSVALRRDQQPIAVWTLEFGNTSLAEETRHVINITSGQVAPILHLALQNERGLMTRTRDRLTAAVKWVFGKEHSWRKAGLVGAAALLAAGVFGRRDFHVVSSCRLEASSQRIYSAPFNTTIKAALVQPGDRVLQGQTLIELDSEEEELKLRQARSNWMSLEKRMSTYVAESKAAQYAEAKALQQALAAEIELLEHHIARSVITADLAGIIIAGDLRKHIGRPVRVGDELVKIAPLENLLLELAIEQGDIAYVRVGQEGSFSTRARPNVALPFTVSRIRPMPEVRDRTSVYIGEATTASTEGWLSPGMEGAAKVKIGRRNVTWIATRKVLDWIRLHLWW